MSTRRRRHTMVWFDEGGRMHAGHRRTVTRGASLGGIPRSARLVDVHCPKGHLIAVLATNGDGPPLLYIHGVGGVPHPTAALLDGGLVPIILSFDDPADLRVGALGDPLPTANARCSKCRRTLPVPADRLGVLADRPQWRRVSALNLT